MYLTNNPLPPVHRAFIAIKNKAKLPALRRHARSVLASAILPLAWLVVPIAAQARTPQVPVAPTSATAPPQHCPAPPITDPAIIQATAKQPQPDRGVLWELRKGTQTGYLFGTIHVGKLAWVFPGPRTAQALRNAPAIALELNPLDPATVQALMQALRDDSDVQRLIMRNNPQLVARMDGIAQSMCIDSSGWKQTNSTAGKLLALAMTDIARTGYNVAYGIDVNLAAMAQAGKRPIHALETAQEQIEAMGLDAGSSLKKAATPDEIDKLLGDIHNGKNRQVIEELASHWQSGDLAAIDTMMRTCNCMDDIDMKAALLDTRNQRMAARIPALLDANPQLFIAVGLLHMVGENNLVDLLRQQGFTVRQLTGKGAAPASAP